MNFFESNRSFRPKDFAAKGLVVLAGLAGLLGLTALLLNFIRRLRRLWKRASLDLDAPAVAMTPRPFDPYPTITGETSSHYEKPQLQGRPFMIGVWVFFGTLTLILIVVWQLAHIWTHGGRAFRIAPAPPTADTRWATQPPQLQIDPAADLQKLRKIEYQRLHTARWLDDSHSYATIPIETAMQLLESATAPGQINTLLPPPQPATPLDLQNQKSRAAAPQMPNP